METKEQMEKEKTSGFHKALTVLGAVLCVILTPILIINCTLIIKSYTNSDKVPDMAGYFPMIVLTDSMYPEIQSGDLILCHTKNPEDIKVGDIISFFDPDGNGTSVVTHRVEEITIDENGGLAWITKGDANNAADRSAVPAEKLVGTYIRRFAGVGRIAMFMQTTQGLIICVVCPILLLLFYDMIRRRMYEKSRKDDTEALMAELEALRAEKEKNKKDI